MSEVVRCMNKGEARACVDRIKSGVADIAEALLDLKEREGWRALGYDSWRECATAEFQWGERRAYQLADWAEVSRALCNMLQKPNPRQAAELKPLLDQPDTMREVVLEAAENERRTGEKVTAATLRKAVRSKINSMAAQAREEMAEASNHWTPEMKASVAPEIMRQRGELMRLVECISELPDAREYGRVHWPELRNGFSEKLEKAMNWLDDFLAEKERALL